MKTRRAAVGGAATLAVACLMLGGAASTARAETLCAPAPVARIATLGAGAEDIVALPLGAGRVRLFVRESCRGFGCGSAPERFRIGYADLTADAVPLNTREAFRPSGEFEPLGMSLVRGLRPGDATLFVLDSVAPRRIWRLEIRNGDIVGARSARWFESDRKELTAWNDIQAVGDVAYVTRFDPYGAFWRTGAWQGLARISPGQQPVLYADGFRGANGIVDLGGVDLVVSDYWNQRLRFVRKDPAAEHGIPRFATAPLPIHPDNLTLDPERGRLLIAGQQSSMLTALNLMAGFVPSPSAVLSIRTSLLGVDAEPTMLWKGGSNVGRSVSVAVPVPGERLALGQIAAPDVLVVGCR